MEVKSIQHPLEEIYNRIQENFRQDFDEMKRFQKICQEKIQEEKINALFKKYV